MLVSLTIHDLAIIEDTTLELSDGLNVLTGETGAGKSIIIEALSLVLGDRAEVELIRRGKERAEVEASFRLAADSPAKVRLAALDLLDRDDPDGLLVRRLVAPGKARAYVNGRQVTIATLAEVTRGLVDVSSQHQHTQLLDPGSHLEILDRFGGLLPERQRFLAAFGEVESQRRKLTELGRRETARASREAFVRFQLTELDEVDPKVGEDESLEGERVKLSHADRLASGAHEVASLVGVSASQGSANERLVVAQRQLDRLKAYDTGLTTLAARLESARIELSDIAAEIKDYGDGVDSDPRRLDAVSERLDQLKRIKKKHGGILEAVIASREALREELSGFESLELEVKEGERELDKRHTRAVELGRLLSAARLKAKADLEARVGTELQSLAMGGAAIRFELQEATELSSEGFERGEIHIQTNRGEGFLPLHKSASGGELARVLLALKRVLMHVDPVETCIFDEVDSGTGGAVGDMIGKKLEEIGAERQVLCITHLPQIAARGRTHLKVMKVADGERTLTHVVRLGGDERVDEVARMLGGVEITKTTREHARELVGRSADAVRSDKKARARRS